VGVVPGDVECPGVRLVDGAVDPGNAGFDGGGDVEESSQTCVVRSCAVSPVKRALADKTSTPGTSRRSVNSTVPSLAEFRVKETTGRPGMTSESATSAPPAALPLKVTVTVTRTSTPTGLCAFRGVIVATSGHAAQRTVVCTDAGFGVPSATLTCAVIVS
jgi:hypothetical protein